MARHTTFAFALTALTVGAVSILADESQTELQPPRFEALNYFLMSDPKQAATLLLKAAAEAGVDIAKKSSTKCNPSIFVPSGLFTPSMSDDAFLRHADLMISRGRAEADTVCLIKFSYYPSIRDFAEMMALGVHFDRGRSDCTYIGRIPYGAAHLLQGKAIVKWLGIYKSRYKLGRGTHFEDTILSVETLITDEEYCRKDLARLNAEILGFHVSRGDGWIISDFEIRLDPSKRSALAALWWVIGINPQGVSSPH